ncbi:uncharacterized protein BDR25DRAFT_207126 [Lindgomyces ingoldianus]|uniref:Uncharacterized protein n=1 Tax=Lindgomyces ingoldianus TaxID=673940 RepID=A0ACB6RH10_9PLEO|nr:uncharacterized protein BDR25DRAFT_207126 [Lindgomyces ingoldianus]KAF2477807.1 hypothetical protein BDR25DRAFT_207126 [Lindgomyces ingoldianus]
MDRDSSPELGSPSLRPKYNKQTGRPIRSGAGQKKSLSGYVDSAVIEDDEPMDSLSEDEEGNPTQSRRTRKRKRTPSPSPPPLDPIIYDEPPDQLSDDESVGMFHHHPSTAPITLQFNVPLGFHGPLLVKLDRSLLVAPHSAAYNMEPRSTRRKLDTATPECQASSPEERRVGFTNLPPELRNKVYRLLFVQDGEFHFGKPDNFCRSAALLRTCKLVHGEACSVLYGENKFVFDRNRHVRGPFWEPVQKEIGYKDVRQFLKMIGPENLAYLRDIKLILEDATPASTPYLHSHEERRYLNDDHLIDCLRVLRLAKLRKLFLNFLGRRMLVRTDVKFLGYLEQIKADEVETDKFIRWYSPSKIHPDVFKNLQKSMTREPKLYIME